MPVTRFWSMEKQIDRITAARDLRAIGNNTANVTDESRQKVVERLSLEVGEAYQIKREIVVKPEPDVKQKFASVMR